MDKSNSDFLKIAITPEDFFGGSAESEIARIKEILLRREADIVHVRHPLFSLEDMRNFLSAIPENLRDRLTLHDHYRLALESAPPQTPTLETPAQETSARNSLALAGGIHVNNRNRETFRKLQHDYTQELQKLRLSCSCHTIEELTQAKKGSFWDYATLSPIFDSISKAGYTSRFRLAELKSILHSTPLRVIALGGVTPDKFPTLKETGFAGAAMLSAYFDNSSFAHNS